MLRIHAASDDSGSQTLYSNNTQKSELLTNQLENYHLCWQRLNQVDRTVGFCVVCIKENEIKCVQCGWKKREKC